MLMFCPVLSTSAISKTMITSAIAAIMMTLTLIPCAREFISLKITKAVFKDYGYSFFSKVREEKLRLTLPP